MERQQTPVTKPGRKKSQATRQRIMVEAARVISREGFRGASLSEIVDLADITTGAFYFHFDSKEGVAREIVTAEAEFAEAKAAAARARAGAPLDVLVAASVAWAREIATNPVVSASVRLFIENLELVDAATYEPYTFWSGLGEELIRRAQAAGDVDEDIDPVAASKFATASFVGTQILSAVTNEHRDLEESVFQMWSYILVGLAKPGYRPDRKTIQAMLAEQPA